MMNKKTYIAPVTEIVLPLLQEPIGEIVNESGSTEGTDPDGDARQSFWMQEEEEMDMTFQSPNLWE